ncbi:MAG: group III truncated hemoglobin [Gemmatimonadota bacterium]
MEGAAPAEREDIRDEDLVEFLRAFYEKLDEDPLLRRYFVDLEMDEHIPRIAAFWSTLVFRTRRYSDNAFAPHERLEGLTSEHFERWVGTLEALLDERYSGPAVERMKTAAHRIAYSMQLRLGISPFAPYRFAADP